MDGLKSTGRSGSPRVRLGAILHRFGLDLGWFEVSGASAGAGRGALLSKLSFFGRGPCERLGLDFAPPRLPSGASLTLLGRSLGLPDRCLGVCVGSKGAFCASLGATFDASGGTLGRSGASLGPPMAPWALRGPFWG